LRHWLRDWLLAIVYLILNFNQKSPTKLYECERCGATYQHDDGYRHWARVCPSIRRHLPTQNLAKTGYRTV
jgi:hypothetical protein